MALFSTMTGRPPRPSPALPRPLRPTCPSQYPPSLPLRYPKLILRRSLTVRIASVPAPTPAPAISLSEGALRHLSKIRKERGVEDLCLRIGVRQGGCSGMSYTMDFENRANAGPDDSVIDYDGFAIVCDPKSILFLFGMQLDYSDALIGGGFAFKNPNAAKTCGCGKSFATEM